MTKKRRKRLRNEQEDEFGGRILKLMFSAWMPSSIYIILYQIRQEQHKKEHKHQEGRKSLTRWGLILIMYFSENLPK